ncbi:MAG: hypothetical protein R2754_08665 [Microthrixaceae bacterium]
MTATDVAPVPEPAIRPALHGPPEPLGWLPATRRILALKVALLTSLARTSLIHAVGLGVGTMAAAIFAGALGLGLALAARTADWPDPVLAVAATMLPVVAVLFGAMVGSEGTIDPRRLAVLPLSNAALSSGVLASALLGPAGLAGVLLCAGVVAGYAPAAPGAIIVVLAVLGLLAVVVTSARLVTNVLGMLVGGRGQRFANLMTASAGLLLAAAAQSISWLMTQPTAWWERTSDSLAWTPTVQLARAVTEAADRPAAALVHLGLGLLVLPLIFWLHGVTFRRFLIATPGSGPPRKRTRRARAPYPTWLPESPAWAVAVRSVRLKLRMPRLLTGFVAALALGIGGSLAVVLSAGENRSPTLVLLGTAAQFSVIFDNQNCFGTDGRALGADLMANGNLSHLVRGKRIAAMFSGALPALVVPPMVAALTGGWSLMPIGLVLGIGSAALASGVSMFVSVNAPVAQPESSNPFASADAGQGCLSGLFLGISLALLGIVTLPPALVIGYLGPGRPLLVAVLVAGALAVDFWLGSVAERSATKLLTNRADKVLTAVTPR